MNVEHPKPIDLGVACGRFIHWLFNTPSSTTPFTTTPHVQLIVVEDESGEYDGLEGYALDRKHRD